jgi:hypothetical protein
MSTPAADTRKTLRGLSNEQIKESLVRMFYELQSRDLEDRRATGQPQGVASEAYLEGTWQEATPEDARKDDHIQGRSRRFIKHPD